MSLSGCDAERNPAMFDEFLSNSKSWLNGKGPSSGIVFSSRIRLARNLAAYPFVGRASFQQKNQILKKIQQAHAQIPLLSRALYLRMTEIEDVDKQFLLERHLVSREHLTSPRGRGLLVSRDEKIAVMINEEDHLRMQAVTSGFNLQECWELLNSIDDRFSKTVGYAFSPELGYLTACPTNVGTGLRGSCMLHLPALVLTKKINKILDLLTKISFTIRGLFGEGTQALGNFFQISNQVRLGLSEREIIENLTGVVNQVKSQEMDARRFLLRKYKLKMEDGVWRALGLLRNCRLVSTQESLEHLSMLSLGLDLGIIKDSHLCEKGKGRELLNNLFLSVHPAHLQKIEHKVLNEKERDSVRADVLRERLSPC
ncbi:MAG: protein arginine kinase [Candidatus Omnitrophica bacterium]|nr:protein arginine kinase [Candidatus Omnitrophota bacterium]